MLDSNYVTLAFWEFCKYFLAKFIALIHVCKLAALFCVVLLIFHETLVLLICFRKVMQFFNSESLRIKWIQKQTHTHIISRNGSSMGTRALNTSSNKGINSSNSKPYRISFRYFPSKTTSHTPSQTLDLMGFFRAHWVCG